MSLIKNNKGFSLIELMVVVAIIGILSAVGIPQYTKFQSKARQSEAKGALSALYTAEASFFAEWSQYSIDLRNIGFGVSGTNLRYITGFAPVACTGYVAPPAPAETVAATNSWSDGANVNVAGSTQTAGFLFVPAARTLAGTTSACQASALPAPGQSFQAMSIGDPNTNIGTVTRDGWTITQGKVLSNSTPGIR